ncbi:MAG: hypothetical protein ACOCYE_14340 [Pseudomonadota bacterium]
MLTSAGRAFSVMLLVACWAGASAAAPTACVEAIARAESAAPLPKGLLGAIALVESGRTVPEAGFVPWPWTINSPLGAFYLDDRASAVAKVEALRAEGVRNIDVGCMQVNLHHHPNAFASLDAAFDPATNVAYAMRFLTTLSGRAPSLFEAVGRYHSHTPSLGQAYAERVFGRLGQSVPAATATDRAQFYRRTRDGWLVRSGDGPWVPLAEAGSRPRTHRSTSFEGWLAGRPRRGH